MKRVLIWLFLLISVIASAQDNYRLINKNLKDIARYISASEFDRALKVVLITDSIFLKSEETENPDYALLKRLMGYIYMESDSLKVAEKYYEESIDLFRDYSGRGDTYYVEALNEYSILLIELQRYSEAEFLLNEALDLFTVKTNQKSPEYAYTLTSLGSLYLETGNYVEAEKKLVEVLHLKRIGKAAFSDDYAYALYLLADCYRSSEKYSSAIELYKEAVGEYRKTNGENSTEYASALAELSGTYTLMSQYSLAEPLINEAIDIEKKVNGEKSEDYAYYLSALADLYKEMSEYDKSEALYKQALEIQRSGGYDASDTYFAMSSLYTIMADFASAQELALKSIAEAEAKGRNTIDYTSSLTLLGNIYTLTGNYDKAEKIYLEVIEIDKSMKLDESGGYAVNLDNLANLYRQNGKEDKALPIINEALAIKEKTFGEMSREVAYSLDNLSSIALSNENYSAAENYSRKVIDIYEKCLGKDHSDYAGSLMGLSWIYMLEGKFSEAEPMLKNSSDILKRTVGENHPWYNNCLSDLASLYESTGRAESAKVLYLKINDNLQYQIRRNFRFLAEKEKEAFISFLSEDFRDVNTFIYNHKSDYPSLTGVAYNNQLGLKGIVLQSSRNLKQAVLNSNDKTLIDLYEKLNNCKSLQVQQEQLPEKQRWLKADSLENISVGMEKELTRGLKGLPGFSDFSGFENNIRYEEVQKSLGEKEAAIEFISFNKYTVLDTTAVNIYCGLILKQGMKYPEIVMLFDEEELQNFIKKYKSANDATTADKIYRYSTGKGDKVKSVPGKNIYDIIWRPMEDYLLDIETVYYSPADLLNKVSFDAIPVTDSTYLSDKYKLVALSSTREIIKKRDELFPVRGQFTTVFYGGIDYDLDTAKMKSSEASSLKGSTISRSRFVNSDNLRGSGFIYLEGTLQEVQRISTLFANRKVQQMVFTGDKATEESFKSFNNLNSPLCLHIATHGFFFPEPAKSESGKGTGRSAVANSYFSSENPLFRSGLIFAGGNHVWKNQPLPSGVEDGILLASEVSEMYFPNTRLVTLSACETGLGEIKGTEGVYGLQRSFKMAGVEYLIISLWQVPDYQTYELMSRFYDNWISGETIHESFRNAQGFMKKKYQGSPSAWAAFVLME